MNPSRDLTGRHISVPRSILRARHLEGFGPRSRTDHGGGGWKQLQGAVSALAQIPDDSPLLAALYDFAEIHAPDFAKAIRGEFTYQKQTKTKNEVTGEVEVVDEVKRVVGDNRYPYDKPYRNPIDTPPIPRVELSRARAVARGGSGVELQGSQRCTGKVGCPCADCSRKRDADWRAAAGDGS